MALTADRVRQILSRKGKIKTAVPEAKPIATEVRLQVDQVLLQRNRSSIYLTPVCGSDSFTRR